MEKKNIKFTLAPLGVFIGIYMLTSLSSYATNKMNLPVLSDMLKFLPDWMILTIGIIMVFICLPLFLSGIYFLGTKGPFSYSKRFSTYGIYKYVRNPMYSGLSFTIIGFGFTFDKTSLAFAGFLWLIITLIQIRREEKRLEGIFGSQYLEYKEKTPSFFPDYRKLFKDINM